MWKEVFKVGKHIDANGNEREWSQEDLDIIVEKYNNQLPDDRHEAPVVIGHPVNNSPAYAWVKELKRDGDILLAKFAQIDPQFEKLIKEGKYKKVSIALYPDMMLRHVGFLGAVPPAVKGLKDSEFNLKQEFCSYEIEQKSNSVEAMLQQCSNTVPTKFKSVPTPFQQKSNSVEAMFQHRFNSASTKSNKIKEKIKENNIYSSPSKFGNFEDKKNNFPPNQKLINYQGGIMPDYEQLFQELLGWLSQTFNEEIANQTANEFERLKLKYLSSENPENQNKGTEANDSVQGVEVNRSREFLELQRKLEKLESDNREMRFNEYFKSQLELGRLVPSQKPFVKLAFEAVKENKGFEFSENGNIVKISGEDLIKRLIESFPVQVEFNEVARKDLYGETDSLAEQNKFIDEYYKNN